ncbi:MAG: hypothetical protein WED34_16505 [Planctomycetales bacterium]
MERRSNSAWTILLVVALVYCGGYGIARWRKVLVRHEYFVVGEKVGPVATEIVAGRDLRTRGVGRLKNAVAPIAEAVFTPLRYAEAVYWAARQDQSL